MAYFIIVAIILYLIAIISAIDIFNSIRLNSKKKNQNIENVSPLFPKKKIKRIFWVILGAYAHFFLFVCVLEIKAGKTIWYSIAAGLIDCFLITLKPPNLLLLVIFCLMLYQSKKLEK